ncbi:SDR family NAD(P)-dependent oxidoreductase [Agromyces binzhouensis]|uniref:SDR family oxidoreductase n=1 Tax=Agromyces binzhouensis TaxID=1817495 RepID=A0A4Q2JTI3_9MICO|nr:SDR family oxidoreductase [Agromyces binzhouensis]RXZ50039.1 SDR family oxidoreductase [Agromyces binzhouensis]
MDRDFEGTTVLVTGATGGLGSAIAERFAYRGASVVLHHRSRERDAERLAETLAAAHGLVADTVRCDLADERDIERMFRPESPAARATVLVNNAGAYPVAGFLDLGADDWIESFRLNVVAAYLCTRFAAPAMIAAGGGAIVNVTSISADRATPDQAPYGSSKAALRSLTRTSAVALAPHGIRVNSVSPGLVWRDGLETEWPEGLARWSDRAPIGRAVGPREIADACAFLSSPAAAGITGHDLVVDGGITAVSDY